MKDELEKAFRQWCDDNAHDPSSAEAHAFLQGVEVAVNVFDDKFATELLSAHQWARTPKAVERG